jgi:predicted small metal-binding protein
MKTLSCREAGCECDYVAKGETEEDVMREMLYAMTLKNMARHKMI